MFLSLGFSFSRLSRSQFHQQIIKAVEVIQCIGVSERKACKVLNLTRTVKRYKTKKPDDEDLLKEDIIRLASKYGRYGSE
jgi:hypothetical protein